MKDQFIEKDGMLFMKCEPEPLEMDSEMPCLVRLIQDNSRMGIYNRKRYNDKQLASYYVLCWHIYSRDCVSCGDHYSRYEIVAKHCPEGSKGWALWQMLNGKKVCNHSYHGGVPLKISDSSVQKWARNAFEFSCEIVSFTRYFKYQTGWKIYEEPKPEVGKWYINKPSKKYYQHDSTSESNGYRFRQAGSTIFDMIGNSCFLEEFELAPIEPDFSNAKVCDYAFSTIQGSETIGRIDVKDGSRKIINDCYEVDGRFAPLDEHPVLFHSAAQCAAYFAEVALEERKEQ